MACQITVAKHYQKLLQTTLLVSPSLLRAVRDPLVPTWTSKRPKAIMTATKRPVGRFLPHTVPAPRRPLSTASRSRRAYLRCHHRHEPNRFPPSRESSAEAVTRLSWRDSLPYSDDRSCSRGVCVLASQAGRGSPWAIAGGGSAREAPSRSSALLGQTHHTRTITDVVHFNN